MALLKVLVVDDEPGIRSGVARILNNFRVTYPFMDEDYTFEVTEAATGEEGISVIEKDRPDIILLDNKLPGIQGVDVLDYIRNNNLDIVVAMITSYASLDVAVKATHSGAIDFIPKPFTPQELKSSLEHITKQLYLKRITHRLNEEGKRVRYQFLSVLSHELKAPLNAIEGYLMMMREKQLGEKIDDYAVPIERALRRIQGMRTLIMDLLDFTKIKLQRRDDRLQPVDLAEVASDSIATVRPYAIQKEVEITLVKKSDAIVTADPGDMAIIFNNLISNAVKYNVEGGKVEITLDSTNDEVIAVFADTGIGIRPEDKDNLFTEFVRIKRDEIRDVTGSGLGLSIVKKVTDLYKGTISVDSEISKGTIFTVRLPKKKSGFNDAKHETSGKDS